MRDDVFVLPDPDAVGRRAASIFAARAKTIAADSRRFRFVLSGGSTPLKFFEQLGSEYGKEINWDRTDIFWADERCVPPDHSDSNFKRAHDILLSRLDIRSANIHRIKGERLPEEGAGEYEKELRSCFGGEGLPVFDLVILGVGEDGHTASLFPGSPSLKERTRWAIPVYVERLGSWRITLSFPVLNNASEILFLVTGPKKSAIVRELLGGKGNKRRYPAGLVQPVHGNITWLIDREAASLLRRA